MKFDTSAPCFLGFQSLLNAQERQVGRQCSALDFLSVAAPAAGGSGKSVDEQADLLPMGRNCPVLRIRFLPIPPLRAAAALKCARKFHRAGG